MKSRTIIAIFPVKLVGTRTNERRVSEGVGEREGAEKVIRGEAEVGRVGKGGEEERGGERSRRRRGKKE